MRKIYIYIVDLAQQKNRKNRQREVSTRAYPNIASRWNGLMNDSVIFIKSTIIFVVVGFTLYIKQRPKIAIERNKEDGLWP